MKTEMIRGKHHVSPSAASDPDRGTVIARARTVGKPARAAGAHTVTDIAVVQTNSGAGNLTDAVTIHISVNNRSHALAVDPRTSLLDLLRERLALMGAKKGCDHGQCGACTVHIDGRRVVSCLTPAVQVQGRDVTTIEGLTPCGGGLHPMQQAFIDHDALQCGYCTPGQIMSAVACVLEGHATSTEQIREYMSGNICRCGAYVGIVAAIEAAAPQLSRV